MASGRVQSRGGGSGGDQGGVGAATLDRKTGDGAHLCNEWHKSMLVGDSVFGEAGEDDFFQPGDFIERVVQRERLGERLQSAVTTSRTLRAIDGVRIGSVPRSLPIDHVAGRGRVGGRRR